MRSIDVHAHFVPQCAWRELDAGKDWYGFQYQPGLPPDTGGFSSPKLRYTPEERIKDMDEQGVDVHLVSLATPLFGYHLEPVQGLQLARDVNDEITSMVREWPQRFSGLATLPMQDVASAIAELDRAVNVLGLKGAELDMVVNGNNWDEPQFLPLFKAAEEMKAFLFFHPHPTENLITTRTSRYFLANSIGVPAEDTMLVATLIFGGILQKFPDLKACVAHGGGAACFGMGRMDRGWQVRSEARVNIQKPPSTYQRMLYYDCVTNSEVTLRFLIDQVGADRVVLGSDWPYVPWNPSPVTWVLGLESLTHNEKENILWRNLETLLGI